MTIIHVPIKNGYLSGSGSMDYFLASNGLDRLKFSSQQESGWNLPEAAEAMRNGDLLFAGKYSAPDMELLKTGKCDLAIQNTMILHSPAVIEKLEGVGIPVFIDYASLDTTPEGRMEWVKVYGLMTGREEAAEQAFRQQEKEFKTLKKQAVDRPEDEKPTVAFFNVNSNGTVSVRKGTDYIVSMIELAGGEYNLPDAGRENDVNRSTETISMEEFSSI
ncbi:MAG: ABC transporter substrate-binding protein [Clostridia bacterium]|nr:ABC transporter substrate-binding protein [Clostridia bacterium]